MSINHNQLPEATMPISKKNGGFPSERTQLTSEELHLVSGGANKITLPPITIMGYVGGYSSANGTCAVSIYTASWW